MVVDPITIAAGATAVGSEGSAAPTEGSALLEDWTWSPLFGDGIVVASREAIAPPIFCEDVTAGLSTGIAADSEAAWFVEPTGVCETGSCEAGSWEAGS